MNVASQCRTPASELGRFNWLSALEQKRNVLGAEALALARCGPSRRWRLECIGPGAEALTAAFHTAITAPDRQSPDLIMARVAAREETYLVAWRAPSGAAFQDQIEDVGAWLAEREVSSPEALMIECLPFAAALVDKNLSVVAINDRAWTLLTARQGLRGEGETLSLAQNPASKGLRACAARAFDSVDATPALTRIGEGALRYPVAAIRAPSLDLCLLVIVDREHDMRALWRGMTQLDQSELQLASAILASPDWARPA